MKQRSKHFRRLTALLCTLALTLALVPAASAAGAAPMPSKNIGMQAYSGNWSEPVTSYLYQNSQGGLTRVECKMKADYSGYDLVVEEYNSAFQMLNKRSLPMELPWWGGFFSGSQYNFVIYRQNNPNESDSVEVLRVVKYSKDWQRLDSLGVYGENTKVPIEAGTLRCAESNGILHIHTCHKMYKSQKDGLNHQSSMTLSIREDTMTFERTPGFYVSHSFDQYALVDQQGNLVTVDLGDAYPFRGIVMQRIAIPFHIDKMWSLSLYDFFGRTGDNGTFSNLGGLAETSSEYVTAFTTSRFAENRIGFFGEELVYLIYTNKISQQSRKIQISTEKGASKPMLVPTGLGGGYVLWNGGNRAKADGTLYYRTYAEGGNVGELKTAKAPLSDCQPIVYNGKLVWYVTNDSVPAFYTLDESGVKVTIAAAAPGAAELPAVTKAGVPAPNTSKTSKSMVIPNAPDASGYAPTQEDGQRLNALFDAPCGLCGKTSGSCVMNEAMTRKVCNDCYQHNYEAAMRYLDG